MAIQIGLGLALGASGGGGGEPVVTFDFYADSAAAGGGDGSQGAPFSTLAAASSALTNGASLGLIDGSYFQEEISQAARTNVRIGSVPNWLALSSGGWSAGAQTGVYQRVIAGAVGLGLVLREGATELTWVSSQKMCSRIAGTYGVEYDGTDVVLYVHPTGDGNPATNGLVYTHRILPYIDCTSELTGFAAGAQPNVYVVTGVVLSASGTAYLSVQEDGTLLQGKTSEANASADPGSSYRTGNAGTVDIYVHASDSGDPASNGKEYRYSNRLTAITLGSGANVSGVEVNGNRHNDGAIVLGDNSTLTRCVIRNGGKHNALAGFGSTVSYNRILEAHNHTENGIPIVIYSGTAPGGTVHSYVESNIFTLRGLLASPTNQSCVFCHTSSGTVAGNLYIRNNTFIDCFGSLSAGGANISGNVRFDDNYITLSESYTTMPYTFASPHIVANGTDGGASGNKFWFPEPWATTFTATDSLIAATGQRVIDENEFYTGPYFNYLIAALAGVDTPNLTVRNNKGSTLATNFIRLASTVNTIAECTGNIVGVAQGRPIDTLNTSTITLCDNNQWNSSIGFRKGGTTYTWATWVGTAGHDAASGAGGDNRSVGLERGKTAFGDPRDWPNCWFWYDAQVASSITQASGDVSAVADLSGHGRNLVLHEPTPGSDKVSYSTQGGLPYLAPVANGGLKYATQDFNMPLHMIAFVARLNGTLSAASSTQVVMCMTDSANVAPAIKLGSVGASFTNEIVTAQQGGSNAYVYGSGAATYAANVPHLFLLYFDPVTDTGLIEIDGVAVATMTNVSRTTQSLMSGTKGKNLFFLRGEATASPLAGYLGFIAGFGPVSLNAKAALTTYLMTRWGIA